MIDRRVLAIGALAIVGFVGVLVARGGGGGGVNTRRQVWFRGEAIASVVETIEGRGAAEHVRRVVKLEQLGGPDVTVDADLDIDGFAIRARYERPGQRVVEIRNGAIVIDGSVTVPLPSAPIVLLELVPRVRTTTKTDVVLVDLSSAEWIAATMTRRGPEILALVDERIIARARPEGRRAGPGAFVEDDAAPGRPSADTAIALPGVTNVRGRVLGGVVRHLPAISASTTIAHLQPGPFIESTSTEVVGFATPLCAASDTETARRIAEAVRPLVDPRAVAVAPGARRMLAAGGDCDGAAALVVASLRACGFPARAVVGYRLVDGGTDSARLVPHAVAELYRSPTPTDEAGVWWRIDATVPALGDLDDVFLPVAEGLGGALSMGRVIGMVEPGDVVEGADAGP